MQYSPPRLSHQLTARAARAASFDSDTDSAVSDSELFDNHLNCGFGTNSNGWCDFSGHDLDDNDPRKAFHDH